MKKLIVLFAIALCLCATNKAISQVVDSGITGSCTWTLTGTAGNYTLTINGEGAMEDYVMNNGTVNIPWYSYNSSIKILDIQQGVATIGDYAFYNCSRLTSVTIPNSVTTIGYAAFHMCIGLTSVTIPNSVTSIENYAFCICSSLTSVTIPSSVTTIGNSAFADCSSLTSVTIPNSVTIIGKSAFDRCRNVKKLTLGSGLVTIESYAFSESPLDTLISLAINPPALESIDDVFHCSYGGYDYGVQNPAIPVHIPCGRIEAYQNAPGWNYFTNYIDDLPLVNISVKSGNPAMGTANVIRANTCTDNMAIIGATANTGYHFVQWNDSNTDNPRTVTVTEDLVFTAEFKPGVGISEIDASAVAVYPNPAVDNIMVTLPESVAQAVFTLYDMQGRVLIYKYIGSGDAVSVDGLAAGMYVYNVVTEKGSYKGKIEIKK